MRGEAYAYEGGGGRGLQLVSNAAVFVSDGFGANRGIYSRVKSNWLAFLFLYILSQAAG